MLVKHRRIGGSLALKARRKRRGRAEAQSALKAALKNDFPSFRVVQRERSFARATQLQFCTDFSWHQLQKPIGIQVIK